MGSRADRRRTPVAADVHAAGSDGSVPAPGRDPWRPLLGPEVRRHDWPTIVRLYDRLVAIMPTPVVALNCAIAVAEADWPAAALEVLDGLADDLGGYHLLHASRAAMLDSLGRVTESAEAYARAADLANRARG